MSKAALMVLVLISGTIAGCTGDPDGGGNDEFNAETLQGMIEAGLQDFMNNTTVEITTNYYTNETSTTTNNVNGSGGVSSTMNVLSGIQAGELELFVGNTNDSTVSLLVREDAFGDYNFNQPGWGLNGARICIGIGTWVEQLLHTYFSDRDVGFTSVPSADVSESSSKFQTGECDAMAGPTLALQGLRAALEQGDDMNGVGTWISGPFGHQNNSHAYLSGYNFLNLTVSQSRGEASYLEYGYAEITISGTCMSNCTGQDDIISQTLSFDLDSGGGLHGLIFQTEPAITKVTSCENEFDENAWPGYFGPYGLECDLTLSIKAEIDLTSSWYPFDIGDFSDYVFSWGEWTYYLLWTSVPVNMIE